MNVQPYLCFDGRCEEALDFYRRTLGAQVTMLMRFEESPDKDMCPGGAVHGDKIMHSAFRVGGSTIMATDGRNEGKTRFEGFSLSLDAKDEAEAKRLFDALADGGQVQMPLAKTFFSPCFGMVADRFGVSWMIVVLPPDAARGG